MANKTQQVNLSFAAAAHREDFPMLAPKAKPLIYFNNAATALTPTPVLQAMETYYRDYGVNIARGVDLLGYKATRMFESGRNKVAAFLKVKSEEIVFTRGTTAALNLVCAAFGNLVVNEGDEIIVSTNEHHANFIPWQQLALRKRAKFTILDVDSKGRLDVETLQANISKRTKIVATFDMSNVLGGTNDLKALAAVCHAHGAFLIVDGAQGIVHHQVNLRDLDVDFYAFSGHKLYGPTGIGVLYGKYQHLLAMPPVEMGGEMIDQVGDFDTSFALPPMRFEAGTMPIAEVIGLGAAIDYLESIDFEACNRRTTMLTKALVDGLKAQPNIIIYNEDNYTAGIVAFNVRGVHPHDAAGVYDRAGISIRAGQHCTQPTMRHLQVEATLRASLAFYNTETEIDQFLETTKKAGDFLDVLF